MNQRPNREMVREYLRAVPTHPEVDLNLQLPEDNPPIEVPQVVSDRDLLLAVLTLNQNVSRLRRWFFGRYNLVSTVTKSIRTVQPGQTLELGTVDGAFGGSLLFASVAVSNKGVDIEARIDGDVHLFSGTDVYDGRFAAGAPSLLLIRDTPTTAPQIAYAFNPGAPEGFPWFDTLQLILRNTTPTTNIIVYQSYFRAKRFLE